MPNCIISVSESILRTFEVTEIGPLNTEDLVTTLSAAQRTKSSFPLLHAA